MENKKTFTYDEAYNASVKYFDGDELAARVWAGKYALKDSEGILYELTPDDMHHRIAAELARIENKYPNPMSHDEIFHLLKDFRYIVPQGSPMAGIGNNLQTVSLSNCFVIGLDGHPDSYGGIMRVDEEQVQLMKRRGGVGHDLSHLRPKGTPVKTPLSPLRVWCPSWSAIPIPPARWHRMVAEVPSCSPFPDVTLMQRPSSTPRWSRARLPAQMYRYASTTSSCSAPKAASLMFSASPSTASIPLWKGD